MELRLLLSGHASIRTKKKSPFCSPSQVPLSGGHGHEVPFVFGNLAPAGVAGVAAGAGPGAGRTTLPATPEEEALSRTVLNAWASFAKTGYVNSDLNHVQQFLCPLSFGASFPRPGVGLHVLTEGGSVCQPVFYSVVLCMAQGADPGEVHPIDYFLMC